MDNRDDIRDFLASRRAKITPEQSGLPTYGGNRRVPGLRREEVALLAGVSVDYYTRLERGNLKGASEGVLSGSPRRCSSTRPSGPTCPISRGQPTRRRAPVADRRLSGSGRACNVSWTR